MRDIIPFIFWPWCAISILVLLRRRITGGSWRAMVEQEEQAPIEFPPPPPTSPSPPDFASAETAIAPPVAESADDAMPAHLPTPSTIAVAQHDLDRPRSRTLAEAVDGIAMPCDLAPLMGTGGIDPREVAFFTSGHDAGSVGAALADELERLGYEITPTDERSIRAENGPDLIRVRLISAALASEDVMQETHPSAPTDALVVEMKLT